MESTIFKLKSAHLKVLGLFLVGKCATVIAAQDSNEVILSLKPHLCVISGQDDSCSGEITIDWQSPKHVTMCLYRERLSEALECWDNSLGGRYSLIINTRQSQMFFLREAGGTVLARSAFKVIRDQKRYRRARRNPWSFF